MVHFLISSCSCVSCKMYQDLAHIFQEFWTLKILPSLYPTVCPFVYADSQLGYARCHSSFRTKDWKNWSEWKNEISFAGSSKSINILAADNQRRKTRKWLGKVSWPWHQNLGTKENTQTITFLNHPDNANKYEANLFIFSLTICISLNLDYLLQISMVTEYDKKLWQVLLWWFLWS